MNYWEGLDEVDQKWAGFRWQNIPKLPIIDYTLIYFKSSASVAIPCLHDFINLLRLAFNVNRIKFT